MHAPNLQGAIHIIITVLTMPYCLMFSFPFAFIIPHFLHFPLVFSGVSVSQDLYGSESYWVSTTTWGLLFWEKVPYTLASFPKVLCCSERNCYFCSVVFRCLYFWEEENFSGVALLMSRHIINSNIFWTKMGINGLRGFISICKFIGVNVCPL